MQDVEATSSASSDHSPSTDIYITNPCRRTSWKSVDDVRPQRVTGGQHHLRAGDHGGTRIVENTVESANRGVRILGGNQGIQIVGNHISGSRNVGLGMTAARGFGLPPQANTGALISGNTVTGTFTGLGTGIGVNFDTLKDSVIADNTVSDNLFDGIVIWTGNTGNQVRGNIVERSGRFGISAEGGTGNTFEANQMYGSGTLDARDLAYTSNTWIANQCATSSPPEICAGG